MPRAAKTGTPGLYARHTSAGVVYWLTYQGPDGRVFERGGTDKRVAAKMLVSRKAAVLRGDWRPLASAATGTATGEQTVRSYAQTWHKGRVDADVKTARDEWQRLRDYVFPVLGDRPLGEVTREEVVGLMAAVATSPRLANDEKPNASPPAPRTVHRIYEALRQMFSDAARAKVIAENPCTPPSAARQGQGGAAQEGRRGQGLAEVGRVHPRRGRGAHQ